VCGASLSVSVFSVQCTLNDYAHDIRSAHHIQYTALPPKNCSSLYVSGNQEVTVDDRDGLERTYGKEGTKHRAVGEVHSQAKLEGSILDYSDVQGPQTATRWLQCFCTMYRPNAGLPWLTVGIRSVRGRIISGWQKAELEWQNWQNYLAMAK
jgi:hypothetical protein